MKAALATIIGSTLAFSLIATLQSPVRLFLQDMVQFRVDNPFLPAQFVQYIIITSGWFLTLVAIPAAVALWGWVCWVICVWLEAVFGK